MKFKKFYVSILSVLYLCVSLSVPTFAAETQGYENEPIVPMYEIAAETTSLLNISGNTAYCTSKSSSDEYHPYGVPDCEIVQPDDVPFAVSDTNFYNSMKTEIERKEAAYEAKKRMRWSLPTSVDLELTHEQQINYYYCGPATAVMILNDFMEAPTQSVIAGNDYLRTTADNGTPWYSGSTQTSLYYFNMGYGLNKWQYDQAGRTAFSYTVCNSGDKEEYIDKIMDTLSNGYAIPLNGRSRSGVNGYLINYQEGHWVAVEGYTNSGSYFKIVDPAAGIPGFENISQKYTASKSSVRNRISYGIIGDKNELKN